MTESKLRPIKCEIGDCWCGGQGHFPGVSELEEVYRLLAIERGQNSSLHGLMRGANENADFYKQENIKLRTLCDRLAEALEEFMSLADKNYVRREWRRASKVLSDYNKIRGERG